MSKTKLPTHIDIYADKVGLAKDSVVLLEQIRTLDKRRLKEKMGHLDESMMQDINQAIAVSFGLGATVGIGTAGPHAVSVTSTPEALGTTPATAENTGHTHTA